MVKKYGSEEKMLLAAQLQHSLNLRTVIYKYKQKTATIL
jgi:hypothetical protein